MVSKIIFQNFKNTYDINKGISSIKYILKG